MGPLCPWQNSKKPMKKVPGASHGAPLLTPGPRAVPEFPNGQSAPACAPFEAFPSPIALMTTQNVWISLHFMSRGQW
ncbi:unnamed protein product, partial [Staurois parvus]